MVGWWFQRFSCLLLGKMFPFCQTFFGNGLTQPTNKKPSPCGKQSMLHEIWKEHLLFLFVLGKSKSTGCRCATRLIWDIFAAMV